MAGKSSFQLHRCLLVSAKDLLLLTVSWTLQPYRTHSASIRPPEPPTILYGPPQCRSIISIASCRLLTRIRPSSENSTLMVSENARDEGGAKKRGKKNQSSCEVRFKRE